MSITIEVEKDEKAIRDWICRVQENVIIVATPISPKHYGQGPLSNNGHALVKPLSHIDS